jgi:tetratricopeptide (TPR) repeat protein
MEVVTVTSEPVFKPAEDVPLTDGAGSALVAPSNGATAASATVPVSVGSLAGRYNYLSPGRPNPGDRAAAERFLAQGANAQKPADAERAYLKATQLDPSYFEAQYNLGTAAWQLGHLSAALSAYEHAIAINPDATDARYNFAITLKQANYPVDAAHELEKLAARSPDEVRAHLALGNLYAGPLNEPAKAREHYQKVLTADPRHPQANKILYWLAGNPP